MEIGARSRRNQHQIPLHHPPTLGIMMCTRLNCPESSSPDRHHVLSRLLTRRLKGPSKTRPYQSSLTQSLSGWISTVTPLRLVPGRVDSSCCLFLIYSDSKSIMLYCIVIIVFSLTSRQSASHTYYPLGS